MIAFKEKDCPFCYGGGTDDRDNAFRKKCDHSFTELEYSATMCTIADMENQLKENKKVARKMKKIIENKELLDD